MPEGWLTGLSFEAGRSALSVEVDGKYRVFVVEADGSHARARPRSRAAGVGNIEPGAGGGLSADGSLLCIWHSEHGDILHASLRVLDVATGAAVGELEAEGRSLQPAAWSPVPGDQRLAFTSERGDFERPAIWDLATGDAIGDRRRHAGGRLPDAVVAGRRRGSSCVTSSRVGRSCSGSTRSPARARR